nr:3-hydroxy-3-methylglutaryl-coenzyme A reductase 1-like [Tanacetum cinerariifolium]
MHLRPPKPPSNHPTKPPQSTRSSPSPTPKASDALPLLIYLTNTIFFTLFFSVAYFLLHRWRDKIRSSTPLHVITVTELVAIALLIASFIYLLGFFGISFVQSFISKIDDVTFADDDVITSPNPNLHHHTDHNLDKISDEEIVKSVVDGSISSYSLEGNGTIVVEWWEFMVPMATTEGCLVASTNRGCKAIYASGEATAVLLKDRMSRAPVVRFGSVARAACLKFFLEDPINFDTLSIVFNKSSRFARLQSIQCSIAGKNLYIRFTCSTGDAMGMNMVSKGVQNVLDFLQIDFLDMDVIGISGNFCLDKKPAAVNWIEGRGKSVVSVAGSLGGFNAHAANVVSAIFIATGQDPAQNIESSHCITMMEAVNGGRDLHVFVTMPAIEVETVGSGTQLASQSACLNLLGVKGASKESP